MFKINQSLIDSLSFFEEFFGDRSTNDRIYYKDRYKIRDRIDTHQGQRQGLGGFGMSLAVVSEHRSQMSDVSRG